MVFLSMNPLPGGFAVGITFLSHFCDYRQMSVSLRARAPTYPHLGDGGPSSNL